MKRIYAPLIFAISMMFAASPATADDDVLRCVAEVSYNGHVYQVSESAESMNDAKHEVVEDACDQACDYLWGKDEDACERACKASAEIRSIDCVEKVKKNKKSNADKPNKKRNICTAEVVYNGQVYPMTDTVKPHEDAKAELIEDACDLVCDHLRSHKEDACERACRDAAEVRNLSCEAK